MNIEQIDSIRSLLENLHSDIPESALESAVYVADDVDAIKLDSRISFINDDEEVVPAGWHYFLEVDLMREVVESLAGLGFADAADNGLQLEAIKHYAKYDSLEGFHGAMRNK